MNITFTPYYKQPTFQANPVSITKSQILNLRNLGKSEAEIVKELGVSIPTYYKKLKEFGIPSARELFNAKMSKIPKDEFETMLKNKTPIEEICKFFDITTNAYYDLIKKLDLRKYIVGANRKAVTKSKLQELVDKNLPIEQICKELNIGKDAYYELVQKFDIKTNYRSNRANKATITKEMITNLMEMGKTYPEICEELKISGGSLERLMREFEIKTKFQDTKEIISTITKEKLEALVASGKPVDEICKELGIKQRTYTQLLNRFGINTKLKQAIKNAENVKKEDLQNLVDSGLSVEEICKRLHLSGEGIFYKLLKRLNIRYDYKHHAREINIPTATLQRTVKEWKSADSIPDTLGVSGTTFYEKAKNAKVKTVLSDSLKKLKSLNRDEIQEYLDQGAKPEEICELFGIPRSMYPSVIRKFNLTSESKRQRLNAEQITKEQLEKLIKSEKTKKDICAKLNISFNTYQKKLKEFGLE